jgi:hypothetical protein
MVEQQPEVSGSSGPEAGGGLSRLASGDSWFTTYSSLTGRSGAV